MEEGIATHSRTLGWRIPWAEESGGQQSLGSQRLGTLLKQLSTYEHSSEQCFWPDGAAGGTEIPQSLYFMRFCGKVSQKYRVLP